ncbi:MAG: hypothetical protein KGS72_09535 [Cyanobacteria bacterium REEB67]|nr:hypothetical protein [Cyanobacteria bacterium REEB67]
MTISFNSGALGVGIAIIGVAIFQWVFFLIFLKVRLKSTWKDALKRSALSHIPAAILIGIILPVLLSRIPPFGGFLALICMRGFFTPFGDLLFLERQKIKLTAADGFLFFICNWLIVGLFAQTPLAAALRLD